MLVCHNHKIHLWNNFLRVQCLLCQPVLLTSDALAGLGATSAMSSSRSESSATKGCLSQSSARPEGSECLHYLACVHSFQAEASNFPF